MKNISLHKKLRSAIFILYSLLFIPGISAQVRMINEAEALFEAREYESAIPIYQALTAEKNPENWHYRLGDCYFYLKDYGRATEHYQKALNGKNIPADIYLNYGRSLQYQGRYQDAAAQYEIYKSKGGTRPEVDLFISQCQYAPGHQALNPDYAVEQTNLPVRGLLLGLAIYKNGLVFSNPQPLKDEKTQATYKKYRFRYSQWEGDEFGSAQDFASSIHSVHYLGGPSFSSDFNTLYFSANDSEKRFSSPARFEKDGISSTGVNTLNIFATTYNNGGWSQPEALSINSREYSCTHPNITRDGKKLFFASNKPGGAGGYDLYVSELKGGQWTTPVHLGNQVNTAADELYPFAWNDTLLYFASSGHPGLGGADIFVSLYKNGQWQKPENLGKGFNSEKDDFGLVWRHNKEGYFASNRNTEPGVDEVFHFTRIIHYKKGQGVIIDELTLKPIADADIEIYIGDSLVAKVKTDKYGRYEFPQFDPDQEYRLVIKKLGYHDVEMTVNPGKDDLNNLNIKMEPVVEKNVVFTFNDILFEYAKWDLMPDSKIILDRLAELLVKNSGAKVELSAHTDSRGSDKANMTLSQQRATSCVNYLVEKGVLPEQLVAKGYGETRLKNNCGNNSECSEDEHAVNRRVEIKVLDVVQPK